MTTLRMTHDLRRELILSAAKRCFAHNGFAGTTTKSEAAAASISEGLLFKHFPTKSALYAVILAEECKADPGLNQLLDLPPSTETLVILIREMVRHFLDIARERDDDEEAQRLRLVTISYLNDGEFARLMHEKIEGIIGSAFVAAYAQAVKTGDARASSQAPMKSVLVRASRGDDHLAVAAADRAFAVLRQGRKPRSATHRIHPSRDRTERRCHRIAYPSRAAA